jgi:ATP-dependent Clp protease ATP-binding subunit ClpB
MDFEKYTERARGFVQAAQALALREGHQRFTPEHLLKVLLDDPEGLAANLIQTACCWRSRWPRAPRRRRRCSRPA